ncbi:MAG: GlcG/HbpS family heme-binding protein [Limnobaculum xujianqingii]
MSTTITLEQARLVADKALEVAANQYNHRPLSVAICDNHGFLLAFNRMDNAKLLTIDLTQRKAYTAARMSCKTLAFLQRLQKEALDIHYFGDPHFTALPGGIPVFQPDGKLAGAVAIGGLSAEEDHQLAEIVAQYLTEML